jgi:hypothetical protein
VIEKVKLLAVLKSFNGKTSKSLSGWAPPDLVKFSTSEAFHEFIEILKECERNVVIPTTEWLTLIAFLGKATGGERPIAILGMIARGKGKRRA